MSVNTDYICYISQVFFSTVWYIVWITVSAEEEEYFLIILIETEEKRRIPRSHSKYFWGWIINMGKRKKRISLISFSNINFMKYGKFHACFSFWPQNICPFMCSDFLASSHFGWHHWILSIIFLVLQKGRRSHLQHSDIYTYVVWKFGRDEGNRIRNLWIVPAPFLIVFCLHRTNI